MNRIHFWWKWKKYTSPLLVSDTLRKKPKQSCESLTKVTSKSLIRQSDSGQAEISCCCCMPYDLCVNVFMRILRLYVYLCVLCRKRKAGAVKAVSKKSTNSRFSSSHFEETNEWKRATRLERDRKGNWHYTGWNLFCLQSLWRGPSSTNTCFRSIDRWLWSLLRHWFIVLVIAPNSKSPHPRFHWYQVAYTLNGSNDFRIPRDALVTSTDSEQFIHDNEVLSPKTS